MLVIDTYNVLHTAGVLPPDLAGLDVGSLARLIGASRYAGRSVRLVCDGGPAKARERLDGADVIYAGPGREADDLIEQLLRSDAAARSMIVVSSDRRIRRAAKRRRATPLSSEEFLSQLASDAAARRRRALPAFVHDIPLDRVSVAYWLREFKAESGWIASIPAAAPAQPPRPPAPAPREPAGGPPPGRQPPAAPPEPPSATLDPILREALEVWRGRLSLDDLDMRRWLEPPDAPPPARQPRPPSRPR